MLYPALRKKASKLTALTTAAALVIAPICPALAQEKGPAVIRDTESEQLLREYTRPILAAAGLAKQNIQIVIIKDSAFNAFVADGRRIFVNYGAIMQSELRTSSSGCWRTRPGIWRGGISPRCASKCRARRPR